MSLRKGLSKIMTFPELTEPSTRVDQESGIM